MSQPLTADQRLANAAEQARAKAAVDGERAVARAVREEQRRIEREAAREREAGQIAHYKAEFAVDYRVDHLPREVTDRVWAYAWREGHSSGFNGVEHYYQEIAEIVLFAYETGAASADVQSPV